MKIDFAMLETAAEAGATAKVIIAMLKEQYARGDAKRKRDKENKIVARAAPRQRATKGDTERHERNSGGDNARHGATTRDNLFALVPRIVALGLPDAKARSMLGQWAKITRDNVKVIERAIGQAELKRPADAIGWIRACLQERNTINGNHRPSLAEAADDLIDQARTLERAAGIVRSDEPFGGSRGGEVIDGTVAERKTG